PRPLADDEALLRQRAERWAVEPLEELTPARAVRLHRSVVQLVDELGYRVVQLLEREEGPMTKTREDPSLHDLHTDLDLRLILRMRRPRWQHRCLVVTRELFVRPLDLRFIAARARHAALQLIGHNVAWHTAKEFKAPYVRADPVGDLLRPRRFRIGV